MEQSSLALFASIAIVLILMRKIGIGISLFIGSIFLSTAIFGLKGLEVVFQGLVDVYTLKIVAIVVLAFALGHTMEYFGMLEVVADELTKSVGALSFVIIPLLVGLLPMPGGALVSAVMLSPLMKKYPIEAERITFLNYWYRHIWVTVWPLYPSVIIATAVLEIDYPSFAAATYPIALASFISGFIFIRDMGTRLRLSSESFEKIVLNFYPVLLLAVLVSVLKIDLLVALAVSLLILLMHKKGLHKIAEILKKTVDVRIIVLVFAVMTYKAVIEHSGVAESMFSDISSEFSAPIAAFALAFTVGFATGIEMSYSSIALPLLTSFTGIASINAKNLMLVISAGFVGVMLSPLHLCYVLSAEYFKADVAKSYRMLLPSASLVVALTVLTYVFL